MYKEIISYIPYNVLFQYETFNHKKAKDYFINNVIMLDCYGTPLTVDEKIKRYENDGMYLDQETKDKFPCNRTGRIMNINHRFEPIYSIGNGRINFSKRFYQSDLGVKAKPILRPLTDLKKPITIGKNTFIPKQYFKDTTHCEVFEYEGQLHVENLTIGVQLVFQTLMEWHFDIYGLIDKGYAVDINTIKNK